LDIAAILGIVVGFGSIILGYLLEHGILSALFLLSPAIIVFGGTLGAVILSFDLKDLLQVGATLKSVFIVKKGRNSNNTIETFIELSGIARKNGLLALEPYIKSDELNEYFKKGLASTIDGMPIDNIVNLLELDDMIWNEKAKVQVAIFEAAGGFSPTMGIVGTVMGLVQVLGNMSTPEKLAESIAVAFIATLYGVLFANLLYLPLANKIKRKIKGEQLDRMLIMEGITSICNGENPAAIRDKLTIFAEKSKKDQAENGTKEKKPAKVKKEK
jgi:chemotaxis protein MotA